MKTLEITYKVRLYKKEQIAEHTMAFYLEKPIDFSFKPGQYIDVSLIDPPQIDEQGNIRSFSIASAPDDRYLMIATRMQDTAFKRGLEAASLNTEIALDGPFGYFTLHHNPAKPAVFLAGGIGITPFSSMLRHAQGQKRYPPLYLFYANRRPEDAAFLRDMAALEKENPNFRFVPTMTAIGQAERGWRGETGFISAEMLSRYLGPKLRGPIYYVAGTPPMVAAMRDVLRAAGVNEDDVITEDFVGYRVI